MRILDIVLGTKGQRAFKKNTEESAFIWLESDDFIPPSTDGRGGFWIRQLDDKFTRSLADSTEETQRKFVLTAMTNEIVMRMTGTQVDFAAYGYRNANECVDVIMAQFRQKKEEYRQEGLGVKIKNLSPFLMPAYYELYGLKSVNDIFVSRI